MGSFQAVFSRNGFIPQQGQLKTEKGEAAGLIAAFESPGMHLHIWNWGYSVTFFKNQREESLNYLLSKDYRGSLPPQIIEAKKIEVRFQNAKVQALEFLNPTGTYRSYYSPELGDQAANIPVFETVLLKSVWPGIDAKFYYTNDKLKYDFIVHPNADASQIAWAFNGQEQSIIHSDQFTLKTSFGHINEILGSIFQSNGIQVAAKIIPVTEGARLQLNAYDTSQLLTIDPGISWSTYYGSPDIETLTDLKANADGSVVFCGFSNGAAFPVLSGFQSTWAGDFDGIIVKLDATGQRVWATYFGGTGEDKINKLDLSVAGDVIICGETNGVVPSSVGAYQSGNMGGRDAFIASFNPAGIRNWSTHFGGSSDDYAYGLSYDSQNRMYLAGGSLSADLPVFNGFQQVKAGAPGTMDGFLVQFSISGTPGWGTFLGGNLDDVVYDVTTDPFNRVILCGSSGSLNFPILNSTQSFSGITDLFVTQFNSFGQLQWSTLSGGADQDAALGVACNPSGEIFLTGYSKSNNFPLLNAWQNQFGGLEDIIIQRYNGNGQLIWSTYLGGSDADRGNSISVPDNQLIFIGGYTEGNSFPTQYPYQTQSQGMDEGIFSWFDQDGILTFSSYLGGSAGDYVYAVDALSSNEAYAGGLTSSLNFPVLNAYQATNAGGSQNPATQDIFVSKICLSNSTISGNQTICTGNANITVQFSGNGPWDLEYSDGLSSLVITGITQSPYNIQVSPTVTTTYRLVEAWDTQGCGAGWVSGQAVVSFVPALPIAVILGNDSICPGSQANLRIQFSGAAPWDIIYTDGVNQVSITGISSSPFFIPVQPTGNTTYTLVSCTNACGIGTVSGSASIWVDIAAVPQASISGSLLLCPGAIDSFPVMLSGAQPWELSWTDGTQNYTHTGISNSPYFIPVIGVSGMQFQLLSVSNVCGVGTVSGILSIDTIPLPQAGFTFTSDTFKVQFTDNSINADRWEWSFGDAFYDTLQNPQHTYLNAGSYWVRLVSHNSCGSDTAELLISVSIPPDTSNFRIEDVTFSGWKIFPNPSNTGFIYLEHTQAPLIQDIRVFEVGGKQVSVQANIISENLIRLDIGHLPEGVYFLQVKESLGKLFLWAPNNP